MQHNESKKHNLEWEKQVANHEDNKIVLHTSKSFPGSSAVKESTCNAGDLGSFPGSGRSSGEGNCNPLQYLCPENPMDGGARWATVHGVTKSRTRLSDFTFPLCKLWVSTSVLRTSPTQNMGVLRNYCVSSLILMLLWELVSRQFSC